MKEKLNLVQDSAETGSLQETKKQWVKPKVEKIGKEFPEWMVNEALLIREAIQKGAATKKEVETGLKEDREILDVMRKMVNVHFFMEYPPENVKPEDRGREMFNLLQQEIPGYEGITLGDFLAEKKWGVSMALSALDKSTAETVKYCNNKGIDTVGWVVIDDTDGYWTNPANIPQTKEKVEQIKQWQKENDLKMETLGFDMEKPLSYLSRVIDFLWLVEFLCTCIKCQLFVNN